MATGNTLPNILEFTGADVTEGDFKVALNKLLLYLNDVLGPNGEKAGGPSRGIIAFSGTVDQIPAGWALCDGNNGTPDLRDRFIIGAGGTYAVDATGGATSQTATISGNTGATTLDINTMPSHGHAFSLSPSDHNSAPSPAPKTGDSPYMYTNSTTAAGGSQPHAQVEAKRS